MDTDDDDVRKNNFKTVHILVAAVPVFLVITSIIVRGFDEMERTIYVAFFGLFVGVVYFIPAYIAANRNHPNRIGITTLNALGGWLLIGWIGAIVWAVTGSKAAQDKITKVAQSSSNVVSPSVSTGLAEQLSRLNELHQQGALTDDEYQSAKTKLLG